MVRAILDVSERVQTWRNFAHIGSYMVSPTGSPGEGNGKGSGDRTDSRPKSTFGRFAAFFSIESAAEPFLALDAELKSSIEKAQRGLARLIDNYDDDDDRRGN